MIRVADRTWRVLLLYGMLAGWACVHGPADAWAQAPIQLTDVTDDTGIAFTHTDGSSGQRYMIEPITAGVALFDYDRDGDIDIYFLNGSPLFRKSLPGSKPEVAPRNALYRNDGGMKFTDVTDRAGVGDTGFGLGVAVGDYNNDGHLDLYLNNFGPNVLYRNNGNGTFTDVTEAADVGNGQRVGAGANFLDIDNDGDLDLFTANYIEFSLDLHRVYQHYTGHTVYPGPGDYTPTPDTLYRNNGDGTFTDISVQSGIADSSGPGMGTVCADLDDDGDIDIVVANDMKGNFLYQNDGTGKFEEAALFAGLAYDLGGKAQASMGIACADFDNDGRLDLHVTSYQFELASLYRNLGDGFFEDVTRITGVGAGTGADVTWGNGFVDFDNDGDRDIFIASGHVEPDVALYDDATSYMARNILMMNTGDGKFVNVSDQAGDGMAAKYSSRGAAFDDLDGDGDMDVVILNSRREPTILRNDSPGENHWIRIRLVDPRGNRDGVGARVKVVTGDVTQTDAVHSGQGYQSHFGMQPHFGLGKADHVDRIEVHWLGGTVDVLRNVSADRVLTITRSSTP